MKTNDFKSFWDGEECESCNGVIEEKRVELYRHKGRKRFLFENVPAGVCQTCGACYYSANVLKMLDKMKKTSGKTAKTVAVPVLHFS